MAQEHPNATPYRKAADAFRARVLQAIEALVDEDIVWHVPGNHPRAGDIFHFRNGRQVERWFFPEDADAWDRIFAANP